MIGIFGPPGMPKDRIEALAVGCRKVFANQTSHAAANQAGVSLRPLEPAELSKASAALFALVKEMEPLLKPTRCR